MAESAKKGPGRPRKTPKIETAGDEVEANAESPVESNESVSESLQEAYEEVTLNNNESEAQTDPTLKEAVDRLMKLMKGFTPTYNRQQKLSVVNLNDVNTGQGIKYRQLFVEETPGFMVVTIRQGFRSDHGGTDQKKVINSFSVPISEFELYSRVQKRFFGYTPKKNYREATLLLDTLEQTVRK